MIIGIQENLNAPLLDLKTKIKNLNAKTVIPTWLHYQMGGLEVKFFNVLHGPYCHVDNDIHLSTHSKKILKCLLCFNVCCPVGIQQWKEQACSWGMHAVCKEGVYALDV